MSLTPLTSNLGVSRAKHLLRRACFHYNKNLLYTISELNAEQAIEYLLQDNTVSYTEPYDPLPTENPHGFWLSSSEYPPDIPNQARKRGLLSQWWFYNMVNRNNLKDKLLFFLLIFSRIIIIGVRISLRLHKIQYLHHTGPFLPCKL